MLYLSLNYAYVILSNLLVGLLKELFCPLFVTWLQFNIMRSDLSVTRVVMTWQYTAKGCCWPSWPTGQLRCSSLMCCFLRLYRNISIAVDKGHSHSSVLKEKQNKKNITRFILGNPCSITLGVFVLKKIGVSTWKEQQKMHLFDVAWHSAFVSLD